MVREKSNSYLLALCGTVLIASLVCVESNEIQKEVSLNLPNGEGLSNGNEVMHWPWPSRKFKCPSAFGAFPDPSNCAYFYICVAKFATRTRCPIMYHFCKVKRVCLPMLIAVCDDGTVTEKEKTTTQKETLFICPEEEGKFPYPHDCSKYYSCRNDQATLGTCPDSELFDGVKRKCSSAENVHCGSRWRPTDATTPFLDTTTETFTPTTNDVSTDVETETIHEEISTKPEETTTHQEDTTTPQEDTTTPKPRVTAPDTNCDVDDLDCIIDDLGLTPDWFVCPDDLGSYPHPTSNKLFIFCLNWKPLVKKCGQDLVFSENHMTCVSP